MELQDILEKLGVQPPELSDMEKQTVKADIQAMRKELSTWFGKYFEPRTAESPQEYTERLSAALSALTDMVGMSLCVAMRGCDADKLLKVIQLTNNRITAETFDCWRKVNVGLALKDNDESPAESPTPTFVMPGNGEIN